MTVVSKLHEAKSATRLLTSLKGMAYEEGPRKLQELEMTQQHQMHISKTISVMFP